MVVRQNDPGAAVHGRVRDDLTQGEVGATLVTLMPRQVNTAGVIIDMGDEQLLPVRIAVEEALREEGLRGFKAIQFDR